MITLGGIELPQDLVLENEFDWSGVAASVQATLGGWTVAWGSALSAGRPLDLVASTGSGWLMRAQVLALAAFADEAGWRGALVYDGTGFSVRFRCEESPAVDVRPLIPRPNHATTDYYVGRIKLVTV